ncbi:MAG TPA: hypothetical protein VH268_04180, partial [Solirubrobacterales bacterium]|nr:hypothetical protein [Solirubrobacterales bacterium]
RAHTESPIFAEVPVLGFADGVRSLRLKLIDPAGGRLLTWSEARELTASSPPLTSSTLQPEGSAP